MTIQSVWMLPLEEDVAVSAGKVKQLAPRAGFLQRMWTVLAGLGFWCMGLSGVAVAEPWADTLDKRRTGSLFNALAEPPPAGLNGPGIRTQSGDPTASFFFNDVNDVWHTTDSFESSQNFFIRERAAINTDADTTLHLSGTIENEIGSTYGLAKLGAGTLVLSGSNTYQGNTLLLQGALQVANKAAVGPAYTSTLEANTGTVLHYFPGVILQNSLQMQTMDIAGLVPAGSYTSIVPATYADSVQLVVDSGEAIQLGDMAGSAPLVKQGLGVWRFAGLAPAYTGPFTVNQGTLAVDRLFLGPVRVNSGARLQGNGTIGTTTIRAGGILAPGNSIGSLTVVGDLVFEPSSRYEIDAAPDGTADFVSVEGGKALLAGNVVVLPEQGDWQASTSYVVLQAENGLDNTRFDSVSVGQEFAFLTPTLTYEDNDTQVHLTLSRNATPLDEVAETPNEQAVAQELEQDKPPVYEQVLVLDRPRARQAFQQLSNSWPGSIRTSLLEDTRFLREAVIEGGRNRSRFWSHAFHSSADRASYEGIPADDRSIHGLILGISHSINDGLSVGAFLGAQRSDLRRKHNLADAGINSMHAGLTMAGQWQATRFTLSAAHTWHTVKSQRKVTVTGLEDALGSRYGARTTQVFGEVSWPIPWFQAVPDAKGSVIEPFARLAWVHAHMQGFTEQGGNAALTVLPASDSVLFSTAGLRLTHLMETAAGAAKLHGQLAWRHASGALQSVARQTFRDGRQQTVFESEGQPLARGAWQLQLGLDATLAKNAVLGVAYAGQYARRQQDHGVRLNLAMAF